MCETWNVYNFCTVGNTFILGDNESNAIFSGKSCPDIVYIPRTVNGKIVKEIGYKAFNECENIKEIIKNAKE